MFRPCTVLTCPGAKLLRRARHSSLRSLTFPGEALLEFLAMDGAGGGMVVRGRFVLFLFCVCPLSSLPSSSSSLLLFLQKWFLTIENLENTSPVPKNKTQKISMLKTIIAVDSLFSSSLFRHITAFSFHDAEHLTHYFFSCDTRNKHFAIVFKVFQNIFFSE